METKTNFSNSFFEVFLRGQTYLNALYLLMSFPLGILYFVLLITGLALGFPLIIVWVGLLILAGVFALWYGLIVFERQLTISMLHENIPPISRQDLTGKSLWQKFTAALANPVTWKGLVYLLAKLPLGILSFTVEITLLSLSASLVAMPFYYRFIDSNIRITMDGVNYLPYLAIDTLPEALIVCLVGLLVTLVSMHILNGMAWVSGKFARIMLGNFSEEPAIPQPPTSIEAAAPTV